MRTTSDQSNRPSIEKKDSHWRISFGAMGSPCEILIYHDNKSEVEKSASLAFSETRRIEQKFSRYRDDNIIHAINNSNGQPVLLDAETRQLLKYADDCYNLSEGLFDITSGILRKAWVFDGRVADLNEEQIKSLLQLVGWKKAEFSGDSLRLAPGMEIDLGGIGKEYAVDKVAQMLFEAAGRSLMVNFGGDIRAIKSESDDRPWSVGIENPSAEDDAVGVIELAHGAIATSGDARRFCMVNGRRLGHILNPQTGWPVAGAPRSVTVLGNYCMEAGILSTLAMLQGKEAEEFLKEQDVTYHCIW
jgi:FAD:protein FMN transferase